MTMRFIYTKWSHQLSMHNFYFHCYQLSIHNYRYKNPFGFYCHCHLNIDKNYNYLYIIFTLWKNLSLNFKIILLFCNKRSWLRERKVTTDAGEKSNKSYVSTIISKMFWVAVFCIIRGNGYEAGVYVVSFRMYMSASRPVPFISDCGVFRCSVYIRHLVCLCFVLSARELFLTFSRRE